MKTINYFLAFLVVFSFYSCEKVIDLDLNEGNEKIVIEGVINKDSTEHYVKITSTLNFDENKTFPGVDDATVVISDNEGNSQTLSLVSSGLYKTSNFLAVEGRTYNLSVTVDGKEYSSTSTIPTHVEIDTMIFQEFSFGPTAIYYPIPQRFDTPNIKNYYSFNLYKNSERINGIYLQDDQFSDGVDVLQPVFGGEYESGDTLRLEMACIDDKVYKYFYTLSVNGGGTGGVTPANPESNISGGCLGYFSAQTFQSRTLLVP